MSENHFLFFVVLAETKYELLVELLPALVYSLLVLVGAVVEEAAEFALRL